MTIRYEIEKKPYGKTMVAILEDQGVMDLLDGDVSEYFRAYRSTSPEIFADFFKEVFLNDERVAAIMARDKVKEQALALTMSDLYYIIRDITGMCSQTIKRRIDNTPGIIRVKGRHEYYKMARPNFDNRELVMMKQKVAEAKININIMDIDDYDADDMQVILNEERCDSQLSD